MIISVDEYDPSLMAKAIEESWKSGCLRRKVGAVLSTVNYDGIQFITKDCNRPPTSKESCVERGSCLIDESNGRPGCVNTIHAEILVLIKAGMLGRLFHNGILYCTTKPCLGCAKVLVEAGVRIVYYLGVNEVISEETAELVDSIKFIGVQFES